MDSELAPILENLFRPLRVQANPKLGQVEDQLVIFHGQHAVGNAPGAQAIHAEPDLEAKRTPSPPGDNCPKSESHISPPQRKFGNDSPNIDNSTVYHMFLSIGSTERTALSHLKSILDIAGNLRVKITYC